MRLLRLRVRDFGGITEHEVRFATDGVTLVVGPNETGKTSLLRAFDLLLDELDSARSKKVRVCQPVGRSVGPEVEAEMQVGPYRFVYRKRFLRKAETSLEVSEPRQERLAGREAHARVLAILEECTDVQLWRALRIGQGEGTSSPRLASSALSRALDRQAGTAASDDDADTLVDAAETELRAYVGKNGKPLPSGELAKVQARHAGAMREFEDVRRRCAQARADIDTCARLAGELHESKTYREQARADMAARAADVARVAALGEALRDASATAKDAREKASWFAGKLQERLERAEAIATEEAKLADAARERREAAPEVERATDAVAAATNAASAAAERLSAARKAADVARETFDWVDARQDLEQLTERLERVEEARARLSGAEAVLERAQVDDRALQRLRELHLALERARGRADADAPVFAMEALSGIGVEVDGETDGDASQTLDVGERLERNVTDALRLTLRTAGGEDLALISVRGGRGGAEARAAVETARRALGDALSAAGAESLDHAERLAAERAAAERTLDSGQRDVARDLRDLTEEALRHKVSSLSARVAEFEKRARAGRAPDASYDEAQAGVASAATTLRAAEEASQEAEQERTRLAAELAVHERRLAELDEQARVARAALDARRSEEARAAESADDLERLHDEARSAAETAAQEAASARRAATGLDEEQALAALETARAALAQTEADIQRTEKRLEAARVAVGVAGAEGLDERLQNAQSNAEWCKKELDAVQRSADAAALLHEVLTRHRDAARRAYVAPLAERVNALGRQLHGPTFGVRIDDELSIEGRELHGTPVPFVSLSAGAREQLSLMVRLAAAQLVAEDGGVPLFLDDALGHSDPERLRATVAVLGQVARDMQVVVLTCDRHRFRTLAAAHTAELSPRR